jgi:hypothetical protein
MSAARWTADVRAGDWIAGRLHAFATDVGSLVPDDLDAYVRVAHRAREGRPPSAGCLDPGELRALTTILGAHTRSPRDCRFGFWDGYGWLQGAPALAGLAPSGTAVPDVPVIPPGLPRLELPNRPLVLLEGAIDAAAAFCGELVCQSPNLWWPADRAWCVATDIDLPSTYVAGSRELAAQILGDDRLDAVAVAIADRLC